MSAGLCACGCGTRTTIPNHNDRSKGWVKGVPLKWVKGHSVHIASATRSRAAIGNRSISSHGYVVVCEGAGERKYEHVLIAESVLGRALRHFGAGHPENEVVHHINGDKADNRHQNLLICTHAYHVALHARLEKSPEWPEFAMRVRRPDRGVRHV